MVAKDLPTFVIDTYQKRIQAINMMDYFRVYLLQHLGILGHHRGTMLLTTQVFPSNCRTMAPSSDASPPTRFTSLEDDIIDILPRMPVGQILVK